MYDRDLIHAMISLVFRHEFKGAISHLSTLHKNEHFHIQVYRVSFWCSSFMTNRGSSRFIWVIQARQFHERTLQSKCIQAVLASSMWGRDILVSNATGIRYFIYLWMFLQSDRGRGIRERAFVFSEMYHFRLLNWRTLSCYRLRYIQEKDEIS